MYIHIKRIFDLILSSIGLLFLLPLFVFICILLKFTGEGEIFYFQERIGHKKKKFNIWKFATMMKNSANIGTGAITLRNDPRITPVGKILRMTKINELPQIINVIKGDLSLVGARPLLPASFERYTENVQNRIYNTPPGITGIGSLIFRDEEKLVSEATKQGFQPLDFYKQHIYPYKGQLELWYQDHCSLATDFKILFLTFWQILNSKSNLAFKIFKDLPARPEELTTRGIAKMTIST